MISNSTKQTYQTAATEKLNTIAVYSEREKNAIIEALSHFSETGQIPKETPEYVQAQLTAIINDMYNYPNGWGINRHLYASHLAYQNDIDQFRRIVKEQISHKINQLQHYQVSDPTHTSEYQQSLSWSESLFNDLKAQSETVTNPQRLYQITESAMRHLSQVMDYAQYINLGENKRQVIANNAPTVRNFMDGQGMTINQLQHINTKELQFLIHKAEQIEALNKQMIPQKQQYLKYFNRAKHSNEIPSNQSALPLSLLLELPTYSRKALLQNPYTTRQMLDTIGATTQNLSQCDPSHRQTILQNLEQAQKLTKNYNISFNELTQLQKDDLQQLLDPKIQEQDKSSIISNIKPSASNKLQS